MLSENTHDSASWPAAFSLLKSQTNLAVEDALLEAFPHLDHSTAAAALNILIERNHTPALARLVAGYCGYDQDHRSLIVQHLHFFHPALQTAVRSPLLEERLSAVDAVRDADDCDAADLLGDAVRSNCPKTREQAAAALQELTARWMFRAAVDRANHDAATLERQANQLAAALNRAIRGWELHFQRKVLEAALWMGDRVEPAILEKLKDQHSRLAPMLNEILAGASDPRLAGAALRALGYPSARASAVKAVTRVAPPEFFEAVLRESWLLTDPEVTRGCHWIREIAPVVNWIEQMSGLNEGKADRMARWFQAAGGAPGQKADAWRRLLRMGSEPMRRAVLWRLVEDPSEPATALLSMVAAGSNDSIARVAKRELHGRSTRSGTTTEVRMAPNPDPLRPQDHFDDFWARVDSLTEAERTAAAHLVKNSVPNLEDRLRAKLSQSVPTERFRALRMAGDLKLLQAVADRVQQLAFDPDPMVRGLAVSLLAHLPGAATARILRTAIHDPDDRVQANAVEVMDALDLSDRTGVLKGKLSSTNHRVRANAVKALLRAEIREAGDVLLNMLTDASASHRLSALWVVERLKLRSVLQRVAHLSLHDPDERIRRRCLRLFRGLSGDEESTPASGIRHFPFAKPDQKRVSP